MSESFQDVFREHRRSVFGVAYRMLGDANDAEDVVQDTFERFHTSPPDDLERSVEPWLIRTAINLSRDRLRRRSHSVRGAWLPAPVATDELVTSDDPEKRLRELESIRYAFLHAAERLSPAQRAVYLLRQVFEYSVKEAATALSMSESAVKTNLHRARTTLDEVNGPRREVDHETIMEFLQRLAARDYEAVREMLDEEIQTFADGGEHFFAARPLRGRTEVMRLLEALATKYGEVEWALAQVNGEVAVVGRATTVPVGWTRNFVFVPEVRNGSIVAIRSLLDPGKLVRVVGVKHALFIGCTGMLGDAVREIAVQARRSVAVSRSLERAARLPVDSGVEADWRNERSFVDALSCETDGNGPFDLAVVWLHGSGAGVWERLGRVLEPGARVFEVLGSAAVESLDQLDDHSESVPETNHRRIVLGRKRSVDSWRWLTHDEISRGVSEFVRRDRSGVVGEL